MNNRKLLSVSLTILIAVAMLALVAPAVSAQDSGVSLTDGELHQQDVQINQQGPINVTLQPDEVVSGPDGEANYSVVVENATGGIEGYENILIEFEDPSVGNFTSFLETANQNDGDQAPLSKSEIRPSRSGNGTPADSAYSIVSSISRKSSEACSAIPSPKTSRPSRSPVP